MIITIWFLLQSINVSNFQSHVQEGVLGFSNQKQLRTVGIPLNNIMYRLKCYHEVYCQKGWVVIAGLILIQILDQIRCEQKLSSLFLLAEQQQCRKQPGSTYLIFS